MNCPKCGSVKTGKNGVRNGKQNYKCYECSSYFTETTKVSREPEKIEIVKPQGIKPLSEEELRARHDNYFICSQMVSKLSRGNFLPERDFVTFCNFKLGSGYRQAMEDHQFEDYHGQAGGITYWGHKEDIQRLKNEGVLR